MKARAAVLAVLLAAATIAQPAGQSFRTLVPGRGEFTTISSVDTGAGLEATTTVPAGQAWRVIAVSATIVTSATAGNRNASLVFDDGVNITYRGAIRDTFFNSSTILFFWYCGLGGSAAPPLIVFQEAPLPCRNLLTAGSRVSTSTIGLLAGDDYAPLRLHVERFFAR